MERELKRLVVREGFAIDAGNWDERQGIRNGKLPAMAELRKVLQRAPGTSWAGFQVYYPMREKEVRRSSGVDLVEAMMAIFREVTPAMNLCMQIQL
jgi:hypothetical protein